MYKIEEAEIEKLLEGAQERRNLEFKSPFSWVDPGSVWIKECTIRAVLAMANLRLGGDIVIGIGSAPAGTVSIDGVSQKELDSFKDFDLVKGEVDGYCSTGVNFDIYQGNYQGKDFVILRVNEFEYDPVICKKNGKMKGILEVGAVYARAKVGAPASRRVVEIEMREIIRMATDKEKGQLNERGYSRNEDVRSYYDSQINDIYVNS